MFTRTRAASLQLLPTASTVRVVWQPRLAPPASVCTQCRHGSKKASLSRLQRDMIEGHEKAWERRKRERPKEDLSSRIRWLEREISGKKRLAEPAKRKRVLSYCQQWFNEDMLHNNERLLRELVKHDGWLPLRAIATFPQLIGWVDERTVKGAFEGCSPRKAMYEMAAIDGVDVVRPVEFGRRLNALRAAAAAGEEQKRPCLVRAAAMSYAPDPEVAAWKALDRQHAAETAAEIRAQRSKLREYRYLGDVRIASSMPQVNELCGALTQALSQQKRQTGSTHTAIGFDVEYATLEEDLRMQPALLTLGCAELAALIWLDKLPGQGRQVLAQSEPLAALLADSSVLKVGVGSHSDASALLRWSPAPRLHVKSLIDLGRPLARDLAIRRALAHLEEDSLEPDVGWELGGRSLADWTARTLMLRLLKIKTSKANAKLSHWRARELTPNMRNYAANDAAAAAAVWWALVDATPEADRCRLWTPLAAEGEHNELYEEEELPEQTLF